MEAGYLKGTISYRAGVQHLFAIGVLRPLFSFAQRREVALYRVQAGRLQLAKCPFAEKAVCRVVPPG